MNRALRGLLMAASVFGLMLAIFATARAGRAAGAENPPALVCETKVVIYEPPVPSAPSGKGSCWTGSIAVLRNGAWRCMAGNRIYDPCFSVASLPGAVVCGADPALTKPGFVMELTKPLPAADLPARVEPKPWIIRLADGTVCEKLTGTIADIDGQTVPWGCNDSRVNPKPGEQQFFSGVLDNPRRGKVWKVEKVKYSATRDPEHPLTMLERKTVAVRMV
jgi:hypothetical protein